jgi:ATP-binding cassette subfamily A (ABC1) protein 3
MWKTLAGVVVGRSILLTTHSMEEAGALANRAGIMAKRMLAMGTTDYLRHKHGAAYHCHLVTKTAPHTPDEEMARLKDWVLEQFPDAQMEAKTYHGQLRFAVPASSERLKRVPTGDEIVGGAELPRIDGGVGAILAMLEDHTEVLGLAHYAVVSCSSCTANQIKADANRYAEPYDVRPGLLEYC